MCFCIKSVLVFRKRQNSDSEAVPIEGLQQRDGVDHFSNPLYGEEAAGEQLPTVTAAVAVPVANGKV
jgi:hypothetical protein